MNLTTLSKTSTTSIIAIIIVIAVFVNATICLFHKPANENIALLIIGNMFSLAGFVAGYYFNKKMNEDNTTTLSTPGKTTIVSEPKEEE